jgi:hypothetical protein
MQRQFETTRIRANPSANPLWGNTWLSLGQAIVGGPLSPRADELAHSFRHVLSI